ncbi:ABC transporter permease [Halovivax gelatinilyticus]|uniref:ABC transporter permease n=1 Tax=Halovivax gelatinilyticus TaxID=2961597 RepID=UPI0020CA7438|nr:iron ABC transporter permease [Halovivax gelatinilyticus]
MDGINFGRLREREDDASSIGLVLVSGAIAALVTSPLLWLFLRASGVETDRGWRLMTSERTLDILASSIGLMTAVTLLSIAIGVPVAFLTTRTDLPYRRFFTVLAALPLVVPSYIGAYAFVETFGHRGELSSLLGLSMPAIDGFWGAVLVITLYTYPYVFLTTRAALLSIDGSLVDAARTLQAGRFEAFRRVTLPQLRPAIAAGALLVALYAISDFGTPAFMRVDVFTFVIYEEHSYDPEYAALLSLQLLAVAAVVLAIEARIGRGDGYAGARARSARIRLGRWKWPATAGVATLGFVTIALPVIIFGRWLLIADAESVGVYAFEIEWALASLGYALLAALVGAALALPVGYLSATRGGLLSRLFERATYVGFAVPGVVIGLALVFLGTSYTPWLYRTVPLLVFAYVVRFLPQAVGTTRTTVLQVDERLLEAARVMNAGRFETFRRVTLPLIVPGIVAGAALVFLTTMKELPATLMLRPVGTETLATIIYEAHGTAHYRAAAVPALILIGISALSMLILLRQDDLAVDDRD